MPSKSGEFDLSVSLDSSWSKTWIGHVCDSLKATTGKELWDFQYDSAAAEMREVSALLGMEITLYQARHSGPSVDRALKERSLPDVKKRGGWKSWKSVGRYETSARLASSLQKWDTEVLAFCRTCERQLEDIMLGRTVTIDLPRPPKASTLPISSVARAK